MDARGKSRDTDNTLFPELWTTEYLRIVLEDRYVNRPDLHSLPRSDLLDIYYDLILPRPQRTYRRNRRGRLMTAAQILADKRRRISSPEAAQPSVQYHYQEGGSYRSLASSRKPQYSLKPPPSGVNSERKVIRLNAASPEKGHPVVSAKAAESPGDSATLPPAKTSGVVKLKRTSTSSSSVEKEQSKEIPADVHSPLASTSPSPAKQRKKEEVQAAMEEPVKKKPKISKISWP